MHIERPEFIVRCARKTQTVKPLEAVPYEYGALAYIGDIYVSYGTACLVFCGE